MKGIKVQKQLAGTKKGGKTQEQPGTQQNDAESRGQCPTAHAQLGLSPSLSTSSISPPQPITEPKL